VAEIYTAAKHPRLNLNQPLHTSKNLARKIKLAYFSSDFRNHPVSYLTAELFERHDKSRFELIAFSFHAGEKDAMRHRLEKAFDSFIDVSQKSDIEIVQLARQLEIDIAIDLNGCTVGCRTDIFAMRVAPIQVLYLGYSGTMGADYMDYIIADKVVIPDYLQPYYSEKVAYLPHSFMVNDSKRDISDTVFKRSDFGLPENGFVFCCFNNSYKLTPALFDVWMDLLKQVNGSVLWLSESNSEIAKNLRLEAE
jgi:predicted O-linked N-acetylglucosamine transferase (SPINDLY family)